MEIKKTSKANLENKKSRWLLVGYVIVLVFMFVAFEWSKRDVKIDMSGALTENVFELDMEIPITDQKELITPPPPVTPAIAEILTIVTDESNVEETTIASSEELGEKVEIKQPATFLSFTQQAFQIVLSFYVPKVVFLAYYFLFLLANYKIILYQKAEKDSTLGTRYRTRTVYRYYFIAEHSLCSAADICTCIERTRLIIRQQPHHRPDGHGITESHYY